MVEHTHTPDIRTGIPGIQKELGYRDLKPVVAIRMCFKTTKKGWLSLPMIDYTITIESSYPLFVVVVF